MQFLDGGQISLSFLARCFEISRESTKTRLIAAGIVPTGEKKGYLTYPMIPSINALRLAEGPAISGALTEEQASTLPAQERKAWFASEKDRIAVAKATARLLDTEDARQGYTRVMRLVAEACDSIPDELERECRLAPDQVALVDRHLDRVRAALAERVDR